MKKLVFAIAFLFSTAGPLAAQSANVPKPIKSGLLTVAWKNGSIANGGNLTGVAAGSLTMTASKTTCAPPLMTSCNIVYASSVGVVAVTATRQTAVASGNTILALVRTNTTQIISIVYPPDIVATAPVGVGPQFYNCASSSSCSATGEVAIVVAGSANMAAGTVSVSALPFTAADTYGCTVSFSSGTSASISPILITRTSGSAATFAANQAGTQLVNFLCSGY